jgi:hypothetical protein
MAERSLSSSRSAAGSTSTPSNRVPLPQAIAACLAFAAFSVSIAVGISAGNPVETVLTRALLAMLFAFGGGFAVGLVCDWMVAQETRKIDRAMRAELAERDHGQVGLDGLTGVDVIEEGDESLASSGAESEDSSARLSLREKKAA